MDDISSRYEKVLESLDLDETSMESYDTLDIMCLEVELEKAFRIPIDSRKLPKSHEAWIDFIRKSL